MSSRVYARLSAEEATDLDKVRGVIKSPTYCRDAVMWFTGLVEESLNQMDKADVARLLNELLAGRRPRQSRWDRTMLRRVIINLSDEEIARVNHARVAGEDNKQENEKNDGDNDSVMARNTFAYLAVVARVQYALSQRQAVPSLTELGNVIQKTQKTD